MKRITNWFIRSQVRPMVTPIAPKHISGAHDWDKAKAALDYVHQNYKHEQDLYWRRASYFWTLVGAIFVGYVTVARDDSFSLAHVPLRTLIASLGLLFTYGWYLVNRGSRYWHGFWHRRLLARERELLGDPLEANMEKSRLFSLSDYYPFSVTSVNQTLSLVMSFVWVVIVALEVWSEPQLWLRVTYPIIMVVLLVLLTLLSARSVSSWNTGFAQDEHDCT